jgi:hypothetical protein
VADTPWVTAIFEVGVATATATEDKPGDAGRLALALVSDLAPNTTPVIPEIKELPSTVAFDLAVGREAVAPRAKEEFVTRTLVVENAPDAISDTSRFSVRNVLI